MPENTLTSMTVTQFLDALASSAPTPGGGSAAALAGAAGAALLAMVAAMPKTRDELGARYALDEAGAALQALRAKLTALVDEDSRAYDLVSAAFKLPKGTDDEKAARKAAIQQAMQAATEAPLETMRACRQAIEHGCRVAQFGNPNAASDVFVGAELALAGLAGAERNVRINLDSVTDDRYKQQVSQEAAQLLESSTGWINAIRSLVG